MKWSALSGRERRVAILGMVVLGAALSVRLVGIPFFQSVQEAEARLARERAMLEREQRLLADARSYPRDFENASTRLLTAAPRFLAGDTYASSQAALAQSIERIATKASVRVQEVEPLPARPAGEGVAALALRVRGESDLEGVLTLLAALEAGPMLLRVEDLGIRARDGADAPAPETSGVPETLAFEFTVSGYTLAEEPAPAGTSAAPTAGRGSAAPRD